MLDNAIEVTLKGELERIHRILITDKKELQKYDTLKSLLRDAFLNLQLEALLRFRSSTLKRRSTLTKLSIGLPSCILDLAVLGERN
jgi:hypothetical protein